MTNLGYRKMKKTTLTILITAFFAMLFFSSCTKDPEKLIVGKWKVVSASCSDPSDEFYDGFIKAFAYDEGETWSFQEDGTFKGYMNALPYLLYGENTGLISGDIKCNYVCDDTTIKLRDGNLNGSFFDYDYYVKYSFVFTFDIDEISNKDMSITGKLNITMTFENGYTETSNVTKIRYGLEKK